jgi:hypothetical protein
VVWIGLNWFWAGCIWFGSNWESSLCAGVSGLAAGLHRSWQRLCGREGGGSRRSHLETARRTPAVLRRRLFSLNGPRTRLLALAPTASAGEGLPRLLASAVCGGRPRAPEGPVAVVQQPQPPPQVRVARCQLISVAAHLGAALLGRRAARKGGERQKEERFTGVLGSPFQAVRIVCPFQTACIPSEGCCTPSLQIVASEGPPRTARDHALMPCSLVPVSPQIAQDHSPRSAPP